MDQARPGVTTITDILLQAGVVNETQVQAALEHQRAAGIRVGEALVELGAANEHDIGWALARQLGLTFLELSAESLDRDLLAAFPTATLRRLLALPIMRLDHELSVAFGDPTDAEARREMERLAGGSVLASVAAPSELYRILDQLAGEAAVDAARPAARPHGALASRALFAREGSGARVLAEELGNALRAGASEIHYLPRGEQLEVLHRIGAGLVSVATRPAGMVYALLARLDSLGGPAYDGEQTHAQGRAICPLGPGRVLLDVSLLTLESGLAITLGLRPEPTSVVALEALGLDPIDLACVREALHAPQGLVVVSGPPRAGCSTTLASLLQAVPDSGRRAIAFERATGTPLPAGSRLKLPAEAARRDWGEIVVGQSADIVALDDVFTGLHAPGMLASEGSGRLLLASTDWSDVFALLEHLGRAPGGASALASRLLLVIQPRRERPAPGASSAATGEAAGRRAFDVVVAGERLRAALAEAAPAARLRDAAEADGGFRGAATPGLANAGTALPPRSGREGPWRST